MTDVRISQAAALVLRSNDDPDLRVSQSTALVLRSNDDPDLRISQSTALVLRSNDDPDLRISQAVALVLRERIDAVRVTQQYGEAVSSGSAGPQKVRVTQQYGEAVSSGSAGPQKARVTQQYAEAIYVPAVGTLRLTQQVAETISVGGTANELRLTQQVAETISVGGTANEFRLTQQVAEVIYVDLGTDDHVIATQQFAEVLANVGDAVAVRPTQQFAEVVATLDQAGVANGVRVTQAFVEVLVDSGAGAVRPTQQFAEVLTTALPGVVRSTQQFAEVVTAPLGAPPGVADGARITHQITEVLTTGTDADALRTTQQFTEILVGPAVVLVTPTGATGRRVTQQLAEVLYNGGLADAVRSTQQFAEVLVNGNGISGPTVNTVRSTQQFVEVLLKRVFTTTPINDKDVFLQAETIRLEMVVLRPEIGISGDVTIDATLVGIPITEVLDSVALGAAGDSTISILENSATAIVMTSSELFRSGTGTAGTFIGSGGIFSMNSAGLTTFSLDGTTGEATFSGDITGDANINIDGVAVFNGNVVATEMSAAVWANNSLQSRGGVAGLGHDLGGGLFGVGIYGQGADNEIAVGGYFKGSGYFGGGAKAALVADSRDSNQWALELNGFLTTTSSTLVSNLNAEKWNGVLNAGAVAAGSTTTTHNLTNKPGNSTASNTWFQMTIGGVPYVFQAWKKDV